VPPKKRRANCYRATPLARCREVSMKHALILMLVLSSCAYAGEPETPVNPEVFVPGNWKKIGPIGTQDARVLLWEYRDSITELVVAREYRRENKLETLKLYNEKGLNGIQREWYANGRLKSEKAYENNVMHGTFRQYDSLGALVGIYRMANGNGIRSIYDSKGMLEEESGYKNNHGDGWQFKRGAFDSFSIWFYEKDRIIGPAFRFSKNFGIESLTFFDRDGKPNGPAIDFTNIYGTKTKYYVKGMEVSEVQYQNARKTDPTLPDIESIRKDYNATIPEHVKEMLKILKDLKPVEIPLQNSDDPPVLTSVFTK